MKHTARLALLAATISVSAKAAPFMAVGDGAELFVTSSLNVQFDDNIFLDGSNEADDTIISFTPGLDLVFGKGSATEGNLYYREEIRRFNDHDNQNGEFSNVGFNTKSDTGAAKYTFNGSYAQIAQNDNDIRATGSLVRRKVTNVAGTAEFGLTGKTKLGLGASYADTNYAVGSFADARVWSLPVDVYYEATEKLDWSVGYRYRDTEQSGANDNFTDHFLSIGGRGEFTEKLKGQIRVGYNQREIDGGGDDSGFGVDANLQYAYSQKTLIQLNLSNDFSNSATGDGTEVLRWGVTAQSQLTPQWLLRASLSVSSTAYPTRDDDYLDSLVSVSYKYNQFFDLNAAVAIRDNSSSAASAEFSNTVFSIGANVRY